MFRMSEISGADQRRAMESAYATWSAVVKGSADYWARAVVERRTPWDVAGDAFGWWRLATDRRAPTWATEHRVVLETSRSRLRDFTPAGAEDSQVVPTLVIPPQAGHDSCIVDFSAGQSQMQTIIAAGLERAYALDWKSATSETKDSSIVEELAQVEGAVAHMGGRVNLVGDCQGGWLATIYAALHPEQVNTLAIGGAPIDFHAGDAVINDCTQAMSGGGTDMSFYEGLVASGGGVLKGEYLLGGFIAIKPESEIAKNIQLLTDQHDPDLVRRYRAFEDWFKHCQNVPGAFYLWLVEHLFRDNELVRGALVIDGRRVDLADIACPIYLLGGETDHITPPAQVFALADHVSTPKRDIVTHTAPGGHLGLFMGSQALRDAWPPLMAGVLAHSHPAPDPAEAAKAARRRTRRADPPVPAP